MKYEIRCEGGMNGHMPIHTVDERDVWDLLRYIDIFYGRIQYLTLNPPSEGIATVNGKPVHFMEVQ